MSLRGIELHPAWSKRALIVKCFPRNIFIVSKQPWAEKGGPVLTKGFSDGLLQLLHCTVKRFDGDGASGASRQLYSKA